MKFLVPIVTVFEGKYNFKRELCLGTFNEKNLNLSRLPPLRAIRGFTRSNVSLRSARMIFASAGAVSSLFATQPVAIEKQ